MNYQQNPRIGLVPILLLSWVVLLYYSQMLSFNHDFFELIIASLVLFGGVLAFVNKNAKYISKSSLLLVIYFLTLISTLTLTSLSAVDQLHSFTRGLYSAGMYLVTFFIFIEVVKGYLENFKWRSFLSISFFIMLLIIIIGQLLIPEWKMGVGGVRLTGGTNPNFVSFLALFIIFISHFNSLINERWERLDKFNFILSSLVLIWSMSRSSYLGYLVFYLVYLGWPFVKQTLLFLLKGRISKKSIKYFVLILVSIPVIFWVWSKFKQTDLYVYVYLRLTGESGLSTRTLAWEVLLNHFYNSPILGEVGWWNASQVLPDVTGMATSSHSLYVRLFAEVGIVGTVMVMALPIFIILNLIVRSFSEKETKRENIMILICAFLVSSFSLQFFEDKFLVGLFSLGNNIIILSLAFGYVFLFKNINMLKKPINKKKRRFKRYKIVW